MIGGRRIGPARRSAMLLVLLELVAALLGQDALVAADFIFPDFNQTTGVIFVGDAATSSCADMEVLNYGERHGDADLFTEEFRPERSEGPDLFFERTVVTNVQSTAASITNETAGFRHRDKFAPAPKGRCPTRVRLTPSGPDKIGAVWFRKPVPVTRGFDTTFEFQITDMSRECTLHRDVGFSLLHHETCAVRGGDGFALVIQGDSNTTSALGGVAAGLGYEGISNSIAIEFDTWYNPEPNIDLVAVDHITVQSTGNGPNSHKTDGEMSKARAHELADGDIHIARVVYFPYLEFEFLANFTATEQLVPFMKDNTESRRLGTLVVYVDEGVTTNTPLLAIPINLSLLLELPQDVAHVGFTAATGRAWEKHDILSWVWCDEDPCREVDSSKFDYHQKSRHSRARLQFNTPGRGYGGGDSESLPTKHQSPDTSPVEPKIQHRANGRNEGLFEGAASQVPPDTMFRH